MVGHVCRQLIAKHMTMSEVLDEETTTSPACKQSGLWQAKTKFSKNNKTPTNPAATKIARHSLLVQLPANPFLVETEDKQFCMLKRAKSVKRIILSPALAIRLA